MEGAGALATARPEAVKSLVGRLWRILTIRFDRKPIDSVESLVEFLQTRSAYVAQTSLYGYLKARMGIQYPEIFQNDVFSVSINIAKWRTYAACQSDLTVFAAALVAKEVGADRDVVAALARACFEQGIRSTLADSGFDVDAGEAIARFDARIGTVHWTNAVIGENAFTESPAELFASAPIADELKVHDELIVTNSIRFRWRDVREQLRRRIDGQAIWRDWSSRAEAGHD